MLLLNLIVVETELIPWIRNSQRNVICLHTM